MARPLPHSSVSPVSPLQSPSLVLGMPQHLAQSLGWGGLEGGKKEGRKEGRKEVNCPLCSSGQPVRPALTLFYTDRRASLWLVWPRATQPVGVQAALCAQGSSRLSLSSRFLPSLQRTCEGCRWRGCHVLLTCWGPLG